MDELVRIPTWLGAAIVGGLSAVIGFFGKNLWEWWSKQRESRNQRRARLEHLGRLLDESRNLFLSQRAQAQRLVENISISQPDVIEWGLSLDQIFSRAFPNFSPDEARLHAIIRGVTRSAMRRVNEDMSNWLRNDDWFKQDQRGINYHNILAKDLRQLQLHLNEWHSKFFSAFEPDQTLALNYLADEQEQGTGFPVGIEEALKKALEHRRP
jgi:hypothetical protein